MSESGLKWHQVSEIAPGALLAAWAPPQHLNWRTNVLAVATADELQIYDVQIDESSVEARPVWAIPIQQCVD